MDKLETMATFVRIVERGSLSAAARATGVSVPTVVRALAALEETLGVRLLNRTTRRLSLTEEGREYHERCRRVLADIDEAERALGDRRGPPRGRLVVTATVPFGRHHLAPLVSAFVAAHPEVSVELLLLDRIVDLVEEGVDVAVRIGQLPDSDAIALPVGATRRMIVASPRYLRAHGTPRRPGDLAGHPCVRLVSDDRGWELVEDGVATRVRLEGRLTSNDCDAVIAACARGLGVGRFLAYQLRDPLARRELRPILAEFEPPPAPIHIVYPHARLLSARVRGFIDWVAPRLRQIAG